ncbi:MAG TPA: PspC domain-containing protein [Fluviicola sp.]|nr:PspC domain-containing protein [Fluviicola sp.]
MKKTLSIHLGRQLFIIEEDAYDRLQQYLQRLENSLKGEQGVGDIIEDIEMRFAELLMSYLGENRKVVTIDDVEKGIASLGEPEEISEDAPKEEEEPRTRRTEWYEPKQRRLYRDSENGMLAGVAAGCAAYINIDPVIARLIFVILLFTGIGFPLYIIMWIVVPNASTPSERLQMHGRPVTVDSLKEEFNKAGERIKDDVRNARNRYQSGNDHITRRVRSLASIFAKIVGIGIITFCSIWLIFFTLTITGAIDFIPTTGDEEYTSLHDFLKIAVPVNQTFTLMWASILLVGFSAPLFGFVIGSRMIIQRPTRFFKVNMIVFPSLLGIGIVCGIVSGLHISRDFAVYKDLERTKISSNTDVLIIDEISEYYHNQRVVSSGGIDFFYIKNGKVKEEGVMITYMPSPDSLFHISQIVSAHGVDNELASKRCSNINHTMQLLGTKLVVSPTYTYPVADGFRDQEVEIKIEIPEGKKLIIKGVTIQYPFEPESGMLYSNQPFEPWDWH